MYSSKQLHSRPALLQLCSYEECLSDIGRSRSPILQTAKTATRTAKAMLIIETSLTTAPAGFELVATGDDVAVGATAVAVAVAKMLVVVFAGRQPASQSANSAFRALQSLATMKKGPQGCQS